LQSVFALCRTHKTFSSSSSDLFPSLYKLCVRLSHAMFLVECLLKPSSPVTFRITLILPHCVSSPIAFSYFIPRLAGILENPIRLISFLLQNSYTEFFRILNFLDPNMRQRAHTVLPSLYCFSRCSPISTESPPVPVSSFSLTRKELIFTPPSSMMARLPLYPSLPRPSPGSERTF